MWDPLRKSGPQRGSGPPAFSVQLEAADHSRLIWGLERLHADREGVLQWRRPTAALRSLPSSSPPPRRDRRRLLRLPRLCAPGARSAPRFWGPVGNCVDSGLPQPGVAVALLPRRGCWFGVASPPSTRRSFRKWCWSRTSPFWWSSWRIGAGHAVWSPPSLNGLPRYQIFPYSCSLPPFSDFRHWDRHSVHIFPLCLYFVDLRKSDFHDFWISGKCHGGSTLVDEICRDVLLSSYRFVYFKTFKLRSRWTHVLPQRN